jgi:DNA/RNA non-specific endonuclease
VVLHTITTTYYYVDGNDYSGSGYDRGHLCPSGDRTRTSTDNSATFLMTNMIPQAPGNNQGPWAQLENYSRDLAYQGKELSIVAGGYGIKGTIAGGQVDVPTYTWKVILIQDSPIASVTQNTQTLAVWMPNSDIRSSDWRNYIVSVDTVERNTGYNFFSAISDTTEATIESRIYSTAFAFALSSTPISTASVTMAPLPTDSNLAGQFSTATNLREIDQSAALIHRANQSNEEAELVSLGAISLSNAAFVEPIVLPFWEESAYSRSIEPPLPLFVPA